MDKIEYLPSDLTKNQTVTVRFQFLIGYDVFLSVTAEVTEIREGYETTGHEVAILECVEENGGGELYPYAKGCEGLRAAIEEQAVECSHNDKYHVKH